MPDDAEILRAALRRARELGADVAGAVPARRLIDCPSAVADGHRGPTADRGIYIVFGLYHDPGRPELDLWEEGRGTPGDQILANIGRGLSRWLEETYGVRARLIPYQIPRRPTSRMPHDVRRGAWEKQLPTSGHGPRVRFRVRWITAPGEENSRPLPLRRLPRHCIRAARWMPGRRSNRAAWRDGRRCFYRRAQIDHCRE